MSIEKIDFGKLPDGSCAELYVLKNSNGLSARITNYGGIIISLFVPDKKGDLADIVLGYDNLKDYIKSNPYFGSIIGRYGNRIAKGRFTLNGKDYLLAQNNSQNHLHGGNKGFDKVLWDVVSSESDKNQTSITLSYLSPDGDEGYPGNLAVKVKYTLTNTNELAIDYEAATDAPTICSLTQHSYFNLAGHDSGNILGHELLINADSFTQIDSGLIPTGKLLPVSNTVFDFKIVHTVGERINDNQQQLEYGNGYDHNWVLNKDDSKDALTFAASVYEPKSKRAMEVYTTEPGVQFYSGNFLDGTNVGKGGAVYEKRNGLCLETQHYPDSPNKPQFPSVVLNPNEKYYSKTTYRFFTK